MKSTQPNVPHHIPCHTLTQKFLHVGNPIGPEALEFVLNVVHPCFLPTIFRHQEISRWKVSKDSVVGNAFHSEFFRERKTIVAVKT